MKHNVFYLAAILAAALSSCAKENSSATAETTQPAKLTVSLGMDRTKATVADTAEESGIKTLSVFVFKGQSLDGYGTATSSGTVTLSVTTGAREIYAVVNGGDLSSIGSKDELLQTVSLLSDNSSDSYVMVGSKSMTLSVDETVEIAVSRLAARVRISKITRRITDVPSVAALAAEDFRIRRIYLCDAVGNLKLGGGAASPVLWLSSRLSSSATLQTSDPFLYLSLGEGSSIAQNGSYDTPHCFYCYPNSCTSDSETSRMTRLVVECLIDGTVYSYPIPLGAVQANRSYQIDNLTITRLGNPSDGDDIIEEGEDDPIEAGSVTFDIIVSDWEQVFVSGPGEENGQFSI